MWFQGVALTVALLMVTVTGSVTVKVVPVGGGAGGTGGGAGGGGGGGMRPPSLRVVVTSAEVSSTGRDPSTVSLLIVAAPLADLGSERSSRCCCRRSLR